MKTYKTKHIPAVPATDISVEDETLCDICKNSVESGGNWSNDEITIESKEGYSFPEGGSAEYKFVDMCKTCFDNKLIPWLKSQGAEIQTRETDW